MLLTSNAIASPCSLAFSFGCRSLKMLSLLSLLLLIFSASAFLCLRLCVRHACQAPGFPAAARGTVSRTSALSKALRMYFNREYVDIVVRSVCIYRGTSSLGGTSGGLSLEDFADFMDAADGDGPLRSRLPWRRPEPPNHSGKPCSKLKPPGGNLGLSAVLPSVSALVGYMCVVRGVMRGWKMSVENVTRGGARG